MSRRHAFILWVAITAIAVQVPASATSALPGPELPAGWEMTRVDFNEDGYDDYVASDARTGRLRWFTSGEGGWREMSDVEAVDPWRVSSPERRSEVLRSIVAQGDVPRLFAVTFDGRLRVIDTRTGLSALLGSISSFQDRLFPNDLSSVPDSGLTVFSRNYYDGHLYDFRPVSGSLVANHLLDLPQMLDVRGLATRDEDHCYAARFILTANPDTGNELWALHPLSGTASLIGSMGDRFHKTQSLALSTDGVLYGWSISLGQLMRINTATGAAELVGTAQSVRPDIQAMAFAPDGTLFGGRWGLYRIDTQTGLAELVGPTSYGTNQMYINGDIRGLAFASARLKEVVFGLRGGEIPAELVERPRGIIQGYLAGAADLDVSRIDTKSIVVAGDLPVAHCRIADVVDRLDLSGDHGGAGADGFPDLVFSFDSAILFDLFWPVPISEVRQLEVVARTIDGTLLFGSASFSEPIGIRGEKASDVSGASSELSAVPNPFNPQTTFSFALAAPGEVSLVVYDHRGSRVRTLVHGSLPAGDHRIPWDGLSDRGAAVSSGAYRALLRTPGQARSIAVLLLR
jgi:hypothetical protein